MNDNNTNNKDKISPGGILTNIFLLSLVAVNAVWLIISMHGGSFIALIFYLIVSFLCLRYRHYQAGVIAGIFGFGVHIIEFLLAE